MAIPTARVKLVRPESLSGATYKIKPVPLEGEAIYVTINNTKFEEQIRPVEILINTKHQKSYAEISAMARMISAQLQQPGAFPEFVIEELIDTMDPAGGYFTKDHLFNVEPSKRRPEWCPSVLAHIGFVLREHCIALGLIPQGKFKTKQP